jgi:YgiT-type zinc finger domain-containing protein
MDLVMIKKCVICKSSDITTKRVEQEIRLGPDIVLVPVIVPVCDQCGERYYDPKTMRYLEDVKERLKRHTLSTKELGWEFE